LRTLLRYLDFLQVTIHLSLIFTVSKWTDALIYNLYDALHTMSEIRQFIIIKKQIGISFLCL